MYDDWYPEDEDTGWPDEFCGLCGDYYCYGECMDDGISDWRVR